MKTPNVIIIDNDESRREALKTEIENHGAAVGIQSITCRREVFINPADDRRKGKYELDGKRPAYWEECWQEDLIDAHAFDLVFLHIGGNKFHNKFSELKCQKEGIARKIIGYTGGSGSPRWFPRGNYLDNVGTKRVAAKSFHFKEFFQDWSAHEQENYERFGVPWNTRKLAGYVLKYLPALSILCQGYLAAYAESGEYRQDKTVEQALEQMGWTRLKNSHPGPDPAWQLGKKFRQGETVGNAAWFRSIFETDEMNADTLAEEIENEWGHDWKDCEVGKLIDSLYGRKNSNYTPQTVAAAYLAIVQKTGGQP